MEYQHGALLDGEAPDATFQLVAIDDRQDVIRAVARSHGQGADVRGEPSRPTGLLVARPDQGAVQPALETVGVTERPQLPPGTEIGRLHGILGEADIAKDPIRDAEAAVAGGAHERIEGILVALLRQFDQPTIHQALLDCDVPWDAHSLKRARLVERFDRGLSGAAILTALG